MLVLPRRYLVPLTPWRGLAGPREPFSGCLRSGSHLPSAPRLHSPSSDRYRCQTQALREPRVQASQEAVQWKLGAGGRRDEARRGGDSDSPSKIVGVVPQGTVPGPFSWSFAGRIGHPGDAVLRLRSAPPRPPSPSNPALGLGRLVASCHGRLVSVPNTSRACRGPRYRIHGRRHRRRPLSTRFTHHATIWWPSSSAAAGT